MSDDYYYSGLYAEEQAEAEAQQPVAWITPGGDVSRSFYWCLERCLPGQQPRPLYATQPPSEGEEIMVNTPYDVFTLPLQPSGLDGKGPRFVVHVPGAEARGGGEAAPPSAPVGVEEMQRRLDREESDHGRTIDQRDAAEDALGRMFQAVSGRTAEWSSAWGYVDAIEEVEEHVATLAAERDQLAAEIKALRAEVDALRDVLGRILENEASYWKAAEAFGGYVLDDELREEARAALDQEEKK